MVEERPFFKSNNFGWGFIIMAVLIIALLVYNIYFMFTSNNVDTIYAFLIGFFIVAVILYAYTLLSLKYTVKDDELILTAFMSKLVVPIKDIVSLKPAPRRPNEYRVAIYKYPTRKFTTSSQNRWILTWLNNGKTHQVVMNPSQDIIRAIKRKRIRVSRGPGGGKK
ncbi:MAG TPA: tripartite tricarboxylate transporter permease [Clostridia bacterium]|jgi:hypothetical protein|nr:tripartite tricarboxylate transporter permease [Clostridia bacterium]